MKKTLCILALFVFSNIAIAIVPNTYYITDSSGHNETTLTTSTIELPIWYYGKTTSFDLKIEAVGSCTLNQPVITAVGRNSGNDHVGLIETNYWEIYSASDGTNLGTGVASPLATIDFQSGSPGDVTLNLYRYDSISGWVQLNTYSMTIHEIPEPITLVFLGLGGLLLRRRK